MLPRVLFVAIDAYSRVGGLQQFNRRVIESLRRRDADAGAACSSVLLLRDDPRSIPREIAAWVEAPSMRTPLFVANAALAARRVDTLLLGHINLLPIAAAAKVLNRRLKVLLFVHGDEVWGDPVYRAIRPYDRPLLRLVDRIASVSSFTADRMQQAFGLAADRFLIQPNAVDEIAAPQRRLDGGPVILTVTRLDAHDHGKNVDAVIKAVGLLRDRGLSVRLEIIGDGVLRPSLVELSESLGLANLVEFRGRVSSDELAAAYGRASVFALPSAKEGFGIVFLEAWQRGVPVICGTDDASHEIISEGIDGFAVNHRQVNVLAERLMHLLGDIELSESMGLAGRTKVNERYLMPNFVDNFNRCMKELGR